MSIKRVGSTAKYAEGWQHIFAAKGKKKAAAVETPSAPARAKKKSAALRAAKAKKSSRSSGK